MLSPRCGVARMLPWPLTVSVLLFRIPSSRQLLDNLVESAEAFSTRCVSKGLAAQLYSEPTPRLRSGYDERKLHLAPKWGVEKIAASLSINACFLGSFARQAANLSTFRSGDNSPAKSYVDSLALCQGVLTAIVFAAGAKFAGQTADKRLHACA